MNYFTMTTVFSENESSTELLFLRMKIKPVQTTIHLIFILYNHDRIWHYCWLKTSIDDLTLHMSHLVDATAFRKLPIHSNYIKMYYQVLVKKRHKNFIITLENQKSIFVLIRKYMHICRAHLIFIKGGKQNLSKICARKWDIS